MMIEYMESVQDDIFELGRVECCEVSLSYNTTYPKHSGFKINTNVLELFESDELDFMYFLAIPDDKKDDKSDKLDEYPIYCADLAQGEIQVTNQNFKLFMKDLLGDKNTEELDKFSDNIMEQTVPEIDEASESEEDE